MIYILISLIAFFVGVMVGDYHAIEGGENSGQKNT